MVYRLTRHLQGRYHRSGSSSGQLALSTRPRDVRQINEPLSDTLHASDSETLFTPSEDCFSSVKPTKSRRLQLVLKISILSHTAQTDHIKPQQWRW